MARPAGWAGGSRSGSGPARPGPEAYFRAQGEVSEFPGGVEATADEFLLQALDSYLPMSDELLVPVVRALATGAAHSPVPAPFALPAAADRHLAQVDAVREPDAPTENRGVPASGGGQRRRRRRRIDGELTEPMRQAFSGVLGLLGGSLPNFTAFALYSEYHAFDRNRRVARTRPIGWELSNFAPGRRTPPDEWAEFRGYHRGLR